ncbi:hypothetical protein ACFL2B_02815 [Patescibacteria group bacterium]
MSKKLAKLGKVLGITALSVVMLFTAVQIAQADTDSRAVQLEQINAEAEALKASCPESPCVPTGPSLDTLAGEYGITRDAAAENQGKELLARIYRDHATTYMAALEQEGMYDALLFFISYNYGTTAELGAGERAGVISSWMSAKKEVQGDQVYVPNLLGEWQDIIKIANGRWPENVRNEVYEGDISMTTFQKVYNRTPNRANVHDDAAVMTMAYGLRPQPRNTNSEANAIGFFKGIYDRSPESAADWDIVRAIAYSGAVR